MRQEQSKFDRLAEQKRYNKIKAQSTSGEQKEFDALKNSTSNEQEKFNTLKQERQGDVQQEMREDREIAWDDAYLEFDMELEASLVLDSAPMLSESRYFNSEGRLEIPSRWVEKSFEDGDLVIAHKVVVEDGDDQYAAIFLTDQMNGNESVLGVLSVSNGRLRVPKSVWETGSFRTDWAEITQVGEKDASDCVGFLLC